MPKLLSVLFVWLTLAVSAQEGTIVVNPDNAGNSFGNQVLIFEDVHHQFPANDVLDFPDDSFDVKEFEMPNLDFTTSRWWLKFSIVNQTLNPNLMIEVARPVTNKAFLYEVKQDSALLLYQSGDDYPFSQKIIPHRKNIFPIYINEGQTQEFLIELESDGEVINLPLRVYEKTGFFESDYRHQFAFGFYYGIMLLVVFIYFFFFILLRDKSFLYYIIYVFFQAAMQFSLDGYAYQFLFPSGGYFTNHILIFNVAGAIVFLLFYVSAFLKIKERSPGLLRVYKIALVLALLICVMSFIPGKAYEISFPLINGVSLLMSILAIISVYLMRRKGEKICNYFTMAFAVLILGAILFILGNFNIAGNADFSQDTLKIASALEVIILSLSMSNKYRDLQKEKEDAQAVALQSLEEKNALMDQINIRLEKQVKERTAEIEHQKQELAEINAEILSSIKYAKRIQTAILPAPEHAENVLKEHFVFYLPKDVVSGDFYFIEQANTTDASQKNFSIFAAVDCTGHGVPGAFMSIVGNNYLVQGLTEPSVNSPADALNFLNKGVVKALRQDASNKSNAVRDGMDIALCALENKTKTLHYAGAKNPVYVVRNNSVTNPFGENVPEKNLLKSDSADIWLYEVKADKHPIGAFMDEELQPFTNKEIPVQSGDMIYVFTDGFADQFGGSHLPDGEGKGKKYTYKRFKQFLMAVSQLPTQEQFKKLETEFARWKGNTEQIDDVLVIGVRVG